MTGEPDPPPPNLAVALEYEHGRDHAPRVTASGRGAIAEKIVETARAHGVAVEGNPLLAEALAGVAVDEEIPEDLYRAVAEVSGFVLRTAGKLR